MTLWLALPAFFLCAAALLFFFVPVSVTSSLQGRAEPTGSWAVAFGLGVGPIALGAIAAAGVSPFMTCHVFGKQLARWSLSRWFGRPAKKGESNPPARGARPVKLSRVERAVARFFRALDPAHVLEVWWEKERVFEVRSLVMELDYSFRDVALTGKILAGLCALSGVLPDRYAINQTPSWETEDRLALTAEGQFRIWLGRLVLDLLRFMLKESSRARRNAAAPGD